MKKFHLSLTKQIFIGLALGVVVGGTIHYFLDDHPHAKVGPAARSMASSVSSRRFGSTAISAIA